MLCLDNLRQTVATLKGISVLSKTDVIKQTVGKAAATHVVLAAQVDTNHDSNMLLSH